MRLRDHRPRPRLREDGHADRRRWRHWTGVVAAACTALAACGDASPRADLEELLLVAREADALEARARAVAGVAADGDAGARALAAVRASCRRRQVTRLDEVEPSAVSVPERPPASSLLLELGRPAGETGDFEPVDDDAAIAPSRAGVSLERGQVRTTREFALGRDEVGSIEIEARASGPGSILLGWSEEASAPRLKRDKARVELVGDGRFHTYVVDAAAALARGLGSRASVRRFFVASRSESTVDIHSVRVHSRLERYAAAHWGRAHETRGGELRRVLWARDGVSLSWELDVPATAPVLETGLGLVGEDGVFEATVRVAPLDAGDDDARDAGADHTVSNDDRTRRPDADVGTAILSRLVTGPDWEDRSLDLAAWAGRRVRVTISARGSADAVLLLSSPTLRARRGDEATEPFLLVLEDALRPDRLGVYGGPVATPAHARLAEDGLVFERAFAQATQTRTSVPSMMTSLLPSANGTWDFSDSLSERYVTLAEALRACGFATASFLQNGNAGIYAGLARGFDVVFDEEGSGDHARDLLDERLDDWIAAQRGRSWFAYVHILDPHGPWDPPGREDLRATLGERPSHAGEALPRDRALDPAWLSTPTLDARRALYDAEVAANDAALGAFLDRLDARGDLDRAVVAVVADHGEFLGEHGGLWRHHPPGYVEVSRVPFLLRTPRAKPARIDAPVALLDVAPTLLDLAGIDRTGLPMMGESLAPLLRGERARERAVPAEEMFVQDGERRASGCGSFATSRSLWLRPCTRDEDHLGGGMRPARQQSPAPLRLFDLSAGAQAAERTLHPWVRAAFERFLDLTLRRVQQAGIEAWRRRSGGAAARIRSEPGSVERLRGLGYLE